MCEILSKDTPKNIKEELKRLILSDSSELEDAIWDNTQNDALEKLASDLVKSMPTVEDETIVTFLSKIQKPIISHNGFIDSLHFYDKFIGSLPDTASEFKEKYHEAFPVIYDTKHILRSCISLSQHFRNERETSLGNAYKISSKHENFNPE